MSELEGWDLDEEPPAVMEDDMAGGDLDAISANLNPETLVQLIASNPEALAALAKAINGEEPAENLYVFESLPQFVEEYVTRTFRRHLTDSSLRWCELWWEHPEAQVALDAMWHSFESHRKHPSSLSDWLVHRAWPIMDRLTGDQSPFVGCSHTQDGEEGKHQPDQRRLPIAVPDESLFKKWPTKANPKP